MKALNLRIISRNDSSSRWAEVNPILMAGEIGVENDTGKLKVGNGETSWNELSYTTGGASIEKVEKFSDLPLEGNENIIYKVTSSQLLYIWNPLTIYNGQTLPSGYTPISYNDTEHFLIFNNTPIIINDCFSWNV
jgi:hypothetical protein